MSLTAARGPFGEDPAGRFDVPIDRSRPILFCDPVPQRVRAVLGRETVVDSDRVALLHETGSLPVYLFPLEDVRGDLLRRSETEAATQPKGPERRWHVAVDDRVAEDAVWEYVDPPEAASFLRAHVRLVWDAFDEWFVEDEQVFGHPRDPYHRIDVHPTSRHVRVSVDGTVLADSRRTRVLCETALPPRWYFLVDDVDLDLLVPSSTRSRCAYKGSAAYWHVRLADQLLEDLVWSYPDPQHDAEPVRDRLCFFDERVDLEVDGALRERPRTQWSRGG